MDFDLPVSFEIPWSSQCLVNYVYVIGYLSKTYLQLSFRHNSFACNWIVGCPVVMQFSAVFGIFTLDLHPKQLGKWICLFRKYNWIISRINYNDDEYMILSTASQQDMQHWKEPINGKLWLYFSEVDLNMAVARLRNDTSYFIGLMGSIPLTHWGQDKMAVILQRID